MVRREVSDVSGFESRDLMTIIILSKLKLMCILELRETNNYHCVFRFNSPSLYASSHCY